MNNVYKKQWFSTKFTSSSLLNLTWLATVWFTYYLSLCTSLLPDNTLKIHWTSRLPLAFFAGAFFLGLLAFILASFFRKFGFQEPVISTGKVLAPLSALAVPPLFTFILYPLGMPLNFGILINPLFVLLAAVTLCLSAFIREIATRTPVLWRKAFSLGRRHLSPGRIAVILFIGFTGVYTVGVADNNRIRMLVGDEPEYLFLMESLKRYRTAEMTQLLNDPDESYEQGVRRIRPHRSGESREGKVYSVHHLGVPLLMIPFHILKGYNAVLILFVLICSLCVTNLYLYLEEISGRRGLSFLLALLAGLTVPFSHYFRFIYPDLPATLLTLYAYRKFRLKTAQPLQFGLAAAAASYLPWLHVKYLLLSIVLLVMALLQKPIRFKRWTGLGLAYAASALPMMYYFWVAFGTIMPNAQYGGNNPPFSPFFWRGAPGLFIERDHGLLAWSPYLAFAFMGLIPFFRQFKSELIKITILTLPSFIVVASHWMWWGGPCPPARFILPMVPFLFPLLAAALPRVYASTFWRTVFEISLVFSFLVSFDSFINPNELPFHRHIAYQRFMGLDGFPHLPFYVLHRTQDFPPGLRISSAVFLVFALSLVILGPRLRGSPSTRLFPLLAAILFAFFFPGAMSMIQYHLHRDDPTENQNSRQLARMTYQLEQYSLPLQRAGVSEIPALTDGPAVSMPIDRQASAVLTPENYRPGREHWVLWGSYSNLYPLQYHIDFHIRVLGTPGETIGYLDVAADRGETILAQKPLIADGNPDEQVITLSVHPKILMNSTEFRCRMVNFGEVHISRLHLHVSATPAP